MSIKQLMQALPAQLLLPAGKPATPHMTPCSPEYPGQERFEADAVLLLPSLAQPFKNPRMTYCLSDLGS